MINNYLKLLLFMLFFVTGLYGNEPNKIVLVEDCRKETRQAYYDFSSTFLRNVAQFTDEEIVLAATNFSVNPSVGSYQRDDVGARWLRYLSELVHLNADLLRDVDNHLLNGFAEHKTSNKASEVINGERIQNEVIYITHQESDYQKGTADFLLTNFHLRFAPRIVLVSPEFPANSSVLSSQASIYRFSLNGSTNLVPVSNIYYVMGSHLETCLSMTVRSLIERITERHKKQKKKNWVKIIILGKYTFREVVAKGNSEKKNLSEYVSSLKDPKSIDIFDLIDLEGLEDYSVETKPYNQNKQENRSILFYLTGKKSGVKIVLSIRY